MSESELFEFLTGVPASDYQDHSAFLSEIVSRFLNILGYEESSVFFEPLLSLQGHERADIIVAAERTARPWLLLEAKIGSRQAEIHMWEQQIQRYRDLADPEFAVVLGPTALLIYQGDQRRLYDLQSLTLEQTSEVYDLLRRPSTLPAAESLEGTRVLVDKVFVSETFSMILSDFSRRWQKVVSAVTPIEKGRALEDLANLVFEGIPFLTVKYTNLHTASSEIDLVVQNEGWKRTSIFDEFGRYLLAECKNWAEPVGAKHIRDFIGKLRKTRTRLGFFFARNGITGAHGGADALREIHSVFDAEGIYVIVISEEDLLAIGQGKSFYDIIDEQLDRLRFDL